MSSPEGRAFEGLPRVVRRADRKVFRIVAQARSLDGPVDLVGVDGPPFDVIRQRTPHVAAAWEAAVVAVLNKLESAR